MALDLIEECLRRVTDYSRYEQLCTDLMQFAGYEGLEPLGGTKDKCRDSVLLRNGDQTIFHYSVRKDWKTKLWQDAKGARRHGHLCTKMVCVNPAEYTTPERDRCVLEFQTKFGWTLDLFGMQRMASMLRTTAASLIGKYPQIFLSDLIRENRTAQVDVRVNSTRHKRLQLAQIVGYNRGPGPVLIESWFVSWQENSHPHSTRGMTCYRGSLPVRLEEKDKLDIMVALDFNWEGLERMGLVDAEGKHYDAPPDMVKSFIRVAQLHAPPPRKNPEDELTVEQVQSQPVAIKATAEKRPGQKHDQLVVVMRNDGAIPLRTGRASITWVFDTAGAFEAKAHLPGPKVVESESSIDLTRISMADTSSNGSEIRFALHDDMAAALSQLITRGSEIIEVKIEIQVAPKFLVAETDNVREVATAVAQSVVDSWD